MRKLKNIFLAAAVLLLSCNCYKGNIPEINYISLSQSGEWEIIKKDSSNNSGHIKLKNEIWQMHFLHWWPLNDSNINISMAYTTDLLKNLWKMQFSLTGVQGQTEVNGHSAFYVDGTLSDIVKTRFIVWNCPETNRQFLSDCNINISLNTPEEFLELQVNDITNSVCCHISEKKTDNPNLPQKIIHYEENIQLSLPSNWRSDFYVVKPISDKKLPGHYQNGVTEQEGVIWTLIPDSYKEISFIWKKNSEEPSTNNINEVMDIFFNDTTIEWHDTLKLFYYCTNTDKKNISKNKNYFVCEGKYEIITEVENYYPIDTSFYQYKAFLWNSQKTDYLLVTSMVAHNNLWGIPVNLAPTELQFNNFINEEVLKNIKNHPILIQDTAY